MDPELIQAGPIYRCPRTGTKDVKGDLPNLDRLLYPAQTLYGNVLEVPGFPLTS
jgi:hypothetical protein